MTRFTNKIALVTGSSGGIGRATAIRLAAEGASVYCADINTQGLEETVATISEQGGTAVWRQCDVSDEQQVKDTVAECVAKFSGLNILCNIAGILRFDHITELSLENWRKIMAVNLDGTFLFCREALPHLEKTGGNIVNTSSSSALVGLAYGSAYGASKGGVMALTRSITMEYIRRGVRANSVCPAGIKTGMTNNTQVPEGADTSLWGRHENIAGVWGKPEVVASVIAMLASDDASHINGEEIRVDAGALS